MHAASTSGGRSWTRFAYEWDETGNLTRARRWDLAAGTERTTYGTASSVNGTHPTRAPEFDITYQYDGGTRVVKSVVRSTTGTTKYTVYPFSTLEMRGTTLTGSGTAQDYALNTDTTQIRLGAGAVSGRVLYNATMPRTGTSQVHLFLEFGDHLGSATFTIDHATSEVVEYISYTAYGQTENDYRTSRWSNFREPYRFTGKEEDTEVGLNYHGARYYSPALKRWMSADPVTTHEAGSDINPYSYGYGNPTSFVDPDGREPLTILAIVVISAVVAGATNATVQYATTGHVDWGWKGVAGAAVAGAIGGAVGAGVGIAASAASFTPTAAGALGGAAGGAASGGVGTALAGGSAVDIAQSAITGGVSGAVGGAVGVAAGSTSPNAGTAFGGSMVGTGSGTAAGIGFSAAAWGQDPTWQSAAIAFASAFAGTIASTALSSGYQAASEKNTAGRAAETAGGRGRQSMVAELDMGGPAVTCDAGGAPKCGLSAARLMKRTEIEGKVDQLASEFRYRRSPMSGTNRLSVVEATAMRDSEHGMAVILKADGKTIRTTKVQFASGSHIDIGYELNDGETLLALIHSHPPGATGSRFSTGDLNTAKEHKANVYLAQPLDEKYGYGIILYDYNRTKKVYDLP